MSETEMDKQVKSGLTQESSRRPGIAGRSALAAFPVTLPVMAGYLFLGVSYGIYCHSLGLAWFYPVVIAACVYAGSAEFVLANFLLGGFQPLSVFIMIFVINARHLFYGLSMLEKFAGLGWKRLYLIFGMTDETFSINYAVAPPEGTDRGWFMLFITLFNHFYWVAGSGIGWLVGDMLTGQVKGVSFVMTALFVVIFMEQWLKDTNHIPACLGIALTVICIMVFGHEHFVIPAMAAICLMLLILRPVLRNTGKKASASKSSEERK